MKPTYTPRADSLPAQVIGYITNHPGAVLTLDDITDKFSCSRGNIHTNLSKALEASLLKRDLNEDIEYIYMAGPNLPKPQGVDMDTVHRSHRGAVKATPPAPDATPAELPKLEDVEIEQGIPCPGRTGRILLRDWTPLLLKLKPTESFRLPMAARYRLVANITALHKAKSGTFTTRRYPETQQIRAWRIS